MRSLDSMAVGRPRTLIRPESGGKMDMTMRIVVVLPAPVGAEEAAERASRHSQVGVVDRGLLAAAGHALDRDRGGIGVPGVAGSRVLVG